MQQRHVVSKALSECTGCVFGPGPILNGGGTRGLSAGRAQVAISNVQRLALLAHDDWSHTDLGRGFDEVAVWKCRKDFDAFALQYLCNQVGAIHSFTQPLLTE